MADPKEERKKSRLVSLAIVSLFDDGTHERERGVSSTGGIIYTAEYYRFLYYSPPQKSVWGAGWMAAGLGSYIGASR